ncbi:AAA family ATPase [Mycobacterium sp. DSM 3803]|nr:AAA family ATPase [Mycobacterium sp. DSM 3803]
MALEDDLAAWVADRPDWQKDAIRRFCSNETLSDEDIVDIADKLVTDTYPAATSIGPRDIPGSSEHGEPVTIDTISGVAGINALLPDQSLTMGPTGLTIIYGDNASGKSGYARLMRQAVTARIKSDLLGDVFGSTHGEQSASFGYRVGELEQTWNLGEPLRHELSSIRFYDEECGDAYVTTASEISYRPSALTLLDRLSAACDRVRQELSQRLDENGRQRQDLPLLTSGTDAKAFLSSINANTTQEEIDEAIVLPADHDDVLAVKLQEVARLQASDPSREKTRLEQLAAQWVTVRGHVNNVATIVTSEAIQQLANEKARSMALREAARIASQRTFENEPLGEIGSETWRALWEAARRYSRNVAYHVHEFPYVGEGAVCVLCQQQLSSDGVARLTRFEEFVTDTTSRDADASERQLNAKRAHIITLHSVPLSVTNALSNLQSAGEDVTAVETWMAESTSVAIGITDWLDETRPDAPTAPVTSPLPQIDERSQQLRHASQMIDATTYEERLKALQGEVAEMQDRSQLAGAKVQLNLEVNRLRQRKVIDAAKRLTDTTGITRKATTLSTEHVTSVVRDQFTRETERLHLRRVTLDPARGRRDATLEHQPKLLGANIKVSIDHVLSEGEQTALGLAGFLTEVEFDESKSAAILDDPVSSLDAGRRSRVASRLVELAQDRQVIVFTHEATFVNALNKAARDVGVEVTERAILRQGEQPGLVSTKHPWSVKDVPESPWIRRRLGLLDFDQGLVAPLGIVERGFELGRR